jgi:DNA-binding MarR family transcriptional regulator
MTKAATARLAALTALVPRVYHRLSAASEALQAGDGMTTGMRALLLSLEEMGPQSAARLADMRPVSRQYVQRLVDALREKDWIEPVSNPRNRRSPLLALTRKGRARLATLHAVEAPQLKALAAGHDDKDLAAALRVLETLCEQLAPQKTERAA